MSTGDGIEGQKVATSNESKGDPQQFQTVVSAHDEEDLLPVVDDVSFPVWLIAFVGAAERFAWYGPTTPLHESFSKNYIQHSPSSNIPGVLGLREAMATNIVNAMMAAGYLATIPAAVMADMWLGRYRTILVSALVQLCGSAILFETSFPRAVQAGAAEGGLATAIVLISPGSGGVRSSIAPFIGMSQWKHQLPGVDNLFELTGHSQGSKERTKVHHRSRAYNPIYLQCVLLVFRPRASFRHLALLTPRPMMVNVGGLSALMTTILEKYVGYWVAYLVPLCMMVLSVVPLLAWRHTLVQRPPSGSVLPQASRAMMDEAKPEKQQEKHHRQVPWTDTFIDELKSGLLACRVFLLFPVHWLCLNQTFNNLISQAGQMVNSGVPNDTIKSPNPIASIILTPVASKGSDSGPWPGLPWDSYFSTSLWFTPRSCRNYQIMARFPIKSPSPKKMKSMVQSVGMTTAGVGACLAMAFTPITKDPHLVIMYSSLAGVMAVTTVLFGAFFGKHNREKTLLL
ncbi:H+/oligopeptide symporter [Aspergillus oryzae 100-8]|uniref:H+/oligopeptide symporter n=1 Tax=Aspergillus oryzae (strain 3.042) TaxID=1160506 RepID=I7ZZS0_ASPO3|nr:H+/oligopeptide symporter [Aspergillus oryzae 3.042]KDE75741.1 H+/oligopeptide symporter [Aspergillus oryzae 100-8]|eukprot:EIT77787.1 H+/oligopeptide symporter [Aspergillus oryzae 3.042]